MGVSTAHAVAPHLAKLDYDSDKDLVPVMFVGAVPNVLLTTRCRSVWSGWPSKTRIYSAVYDR